ncbi:MAG TPA: cupin domain-containing protein [Blastocatellia bacterium]|nr:cupin domain-containing protein [Blastocatellia bacterium]
MKILAQGCRVTDPNRAEWLSEGTRRYQSPINRANGARDISQTISVFSRGVAPARRNASGEEALYVVKGSGTCVINGFSYEITPGTGIYVPPAERYQIENKSDTPLEIISVCCPEETSVELHSGPVAINPGSSTNAPKLTVHRSERRAIPTGDRSFYLMVDKDIGCKQVTQFIGVIPPSKAPHHYHTYEEAIFILGGSGIVWADDESCEFSAGTSIYLPVGQRHSLENNGSEDVTLLGVFYPSGSPAVRYDD